MLINNYSILQIPSSKKTFGKLYKSSPITSNTYSNQPLSSPLNFNSIPPASIENPSKQELYLRRNFKPFLDKYFSNPRQPFTEQTYNKLLESDKLIFRKILSLEKIPIKEHAKIIFDVTKNLKKYLDKTYPQGYKLIGIGNSPAPFIETMKLLDADATTIPFSVDLLKTHDGCRVYFDENIYSYKEWENYFKSFGIQRNFAQDGKKLIFTDLKASGITLNLFEKVLNKQSFYNTEVISFLELMSFAGISKKKIEEIGQLLMRCDLKYLSENISAKDFVAASIDIVRYPEKVKIQGTHLMSKLLKFHFYDQKNCKFIDKIKTHIKLPLIKL